VRLRLAAFTPGPPQRSGGAAYAGILLPALARRADVVAVSPVPVEWDGPTVAPEDVRPADHDVAVHFLGNNPEHLFAYRSALRFGGVVVSHDLGLRHLLGGFAPEDEAVDLAEQLGPERAAAVRARWSVGVASEREAFLHLLIGRPFRGASAAIVHSRFAAFQLQAELPWLPVFHVPSHTGVVPPHLDPPAAVRARLGLPTRAFVVGLFGYLGGHKRVPQSLDGIAAAVPEATRMGVDLRVVLVGAEVGTDLSRLVEERGLSERATVLGAVDDRTFFEIMAAVDAVVNLRYPTVGETSATLVQAMALGKPVVTTDYGQFAEVKAALHVRPDQSEATGVAGALVRLATCGSCRTRVAELARAAAARADVDGVAAAYVEILEGVHRRTEAPAPRRAGPLVAAGAAAELRGRPVGALDHLRLTGPAPDPAAVLAAANRSLSSAGRLEWAVGPGPPPESWAPGLEEAGFCLRASGDVVIADKWGLPALAAESPESQ